MSLDRDLESEWGDAYNEILNELYDEAVPGADYEDVAMHGLDDGPPLYMRHYLDADTQEELIEDVLDDYSIPEDLYFRAKKAVLLSRGPSTSVSRVDSAREDAGLEPVSDMLEPGDGGDR